MPTLWQSASALLLLPATISALSLDCNHIRVDEQSFNLKKLGGPKTVHRLEWQAPSIENTTFTLDICKPLPRDKNDKNVKQDDRCLDGTWVCAKEYFQRKVNEEDVRPQRVIPIAGQFTKDSGRGMDPKYTRLKGSAGNSDGKEGLLIELHGGKYPNQKSGVPQKAIIEFLCAPKIRGDEGFEKQSTLSDATQYGAMQKKDDDGDGDEAPDLPDPDQYKNLKFVSYEKEGDVEVLRLRWKTKYACEGVSKEPDDDDDGGDNNDTDKSAGWGFFTWFIIIVFLLAATYIIFGSWLNYNRYGARGWDLIPHGDTIRDIPYIIKDGVGNLTDRLKGGDSRGGYSAV